VHDQLITVPTVETLINDRAIVARQESRQEAILLILDLFYIFYPLHGSDCIDWHTDSNIRA
jgi:hypothetical protein